MKTKQREYDIENDKKIVMIQSLEQKATECEKEKNELSSQLENKNQITINLKEAYDNLIKKYQSQEQKLNLLENNKPDDGILLISNQNNNDISINTNISNANSKTDKISSSFDKYAFTTEILVDYIYCLFLYESSVNIQNIANILSSNMNIYINTLFQNQTQSGSIVTEYIIYNRLAIEWGSSSDLVIRIEHHLRLKKSLQYPGHFSGISKHLL